MVRPSIRNATLGLIGQLPLVGDGIVRSIEGHWPSQREREQAALIEAQREELDAQRRQLAELQRRLATLDSYEGARQHAKRLATLRRFGNIGDR